jgi:hypothetical protein
VLRVRHTFRLARELTGFAVVNRALWFVPLVLALALLAAFVTVGAAAAPYTIYTLF